HKLLDDLAEATIDGTRKECMELFVSVPLLIVDDLGMRIYETQTVALALRPWLTKSAIALIENWPRRSKLHPIID
ncbi:MAG: hypothetical protein WA795_16640, partial [Candidatus Sulfotelmatobacter sp.]